MGQATRGRYRNLRRSWLAAVLAVTLLVPAGVAGANGAEGSTVGVFTSGASCGATSVANNGNVTGSVYTASTFQLGNNGKVDGPVHSNADLKVGNNGRHLGDGPVTYVGSVRLGANTRTWDPVQVPSQVTPAYPIAYGLDDFAPGGSQATAAGTSYFPSTGTLNVKNNGKLASGLYYVDGDVVIGNNARGSNVTIAATGKITIANNANFTPFVDGLFAISGAGNGSCTGKAITVGNNARLGSLFAPNGVVNVANNATISGAVVAVSASLANNAKVTGLETSVPDVPKVRNFSATLAPTEALAGTSVAFDLTVTNDASSTAALSEIHVALPDGFALVGISAPSGWSVSGTEVNATGAGLAPGESVVLVVTAVTATQTDNTTYAFGVTAFDGADEFAYVGGPLEVLVTGTAVACEGGETCSTSLSEGGTNAVVNVDCATGEECGNLVLDLDDNCLGMTCLGKAMFWTPPAGAKGFVHLKLEVPKDGSYGYRDYKYGSYKYGYYHELPKFYIVGSEGGDPEVCNPHGEIKCFYWVEKTHHKYIFHIKVEPVDPRGFAS